MDVFLARSDRRYLWAVLVMVCVVYIIVVLKF